MIPRLPTELLYHILGSHSLCPHDLTQIALTCKTLLPFARQNLYHSIEARRYGVWALLPLRLRDVHWSYHWQNPIEVLRSNPILPPLVKQLQISSNMSFPQLVVYREFLSTIVSICPNLEILILNKWWWDPTESMPLPINFGNYGGKLSIRLDLASNFLERLELTAPLKIPLTSFDSYHTQFKPEVIPKILAASTTSLRAVALPLLKSYSDISFPNLTSLRIYYNRSYSGLELLVEAIQHFKQLTRFAIRTMGPDIPIDLLKQIIHSHLPHKLRWFSIENDLGTEGVFELAAALPCDTYLAELNYPRAYWGWDEEHKTKVEDIRRSKGVELTTSKHWELWKDFCKPRGLPLIPSSTTDKIHVSTDIEGADEKNDV